MQRLVLITTTQGHDVRECRPNQSEKKLCFLDLPRARNPVARPVECASFFFLFPSKSTARRTNKNDMRRWVLNLI